MQIYFESEGTLEAFAALLAAASADARAEGLLILAADANRLDPKAVGPLLQAVEIPIVGGVFPQIIHDGRNHIRGTVIVTLPVRPRVCTVPGLSDPAVDYEAWLDDHLPEEWDESTVFVWADGLSTRIGSLIDALFTVMGGAVNYIGGGAGSLSFEQRPCLFTNQGMLMDAAVLARMHVESTIGVKHGWSTMSGPYKVTESQGNVIKSLNWEPAFHVYRQAIEAGSGLTITHEGFFALAKRHPFGIKRLDAEILVRDPIVAGEDGSLTCVGDVPTDVFVDILRGSSDALINAAGEALEIATAGYHPDRRQAIILIDCISRVLYLEEEFSRELDRVVSTNIPVFGALTLGEIANGGGNYLEFFNKTVVVGMLTA